MPIVNALTILFFKDLRKDWDLHLTEAEINFVHKILSFYETYVNYK